MSSDTAATAVVTTTTTSTTMDVIREKLNPTVLSFFRSLNEIEYSANIEFETLKPFGDVSNDSCVYKNRRRYYERPEKIAWRSDDGHTHKIVNIVRVDGFFGDDDNDNDENGNREPIITTKFKIYKEKFRGSVANEGTEQQSTDDQTYSFTGSIELPVSNVDVGLFKKPFKKMLHITYWHLLINDKYVFRVAFRENVISGRIQCNIECETQSITRQEFVEYFQMLKAHYVYQNVWMSTIEPWGCESEPSKHSVRVISKEQANDIDSQFEFQPLDGNFFYHHTSFTVELMI